MEDFKFTGLFYTQGKDKFRKYLNIKLQSTNKTIPELMVVMMNPGSSTPLNGLDNENVETELIIDKTQNQIKAVMEACNFEYARVLNLSDFRDPKSQSFYNQIPRLNKNSNHSIFSPIRQEDFNNLFIPNAPTILAWGVNTKLKELTSLAFDKISKNTNEIFYLTKNLQKKCFYHPLPRSVSKQKEWVSSISKMINNQREK
jgi:hypothetical protein